MPLISDYLVQNNEEDSSILHTKLPDINIRLFKSARAGYRSFIYGIVMYMSGIMKIDFDDYDTKLKGLSGANVGIPLNIVCIRIEGDKGLPKDYTKYISLPEVFFYLNPKIVKHSKGATIVSSSCGSLADGRPVKVARYLWVDVEHYNLDGEKELHRYHRPYSCTFQHEIDHNSGILITDKPVKEE